MCTLDWTVQYPLISCLILSDLLVQNQILLSTQNQELAQNDHHPPEEQVTQQQKRGFIVYFNQVYTSLDLNPLSAIFPR
jgi:hypothetical protein